MDDEGRDISLDGFYLRGETLGLLVGEPRGMCDVFPVRYVVLDDGEKKNKGPNGGSGTAAAEAVASRRRPYTSHMGPLVGRRQQTSPFVRVRVCALTHIL